jgi:hypothetical protein
MEEKPKRAASVGKVEVAAGAGSGQASVPPPALEEPEGNSISQPKVT